MQFVQKQGKTKRHATFADVLVGQVFFRGNCAFMRIDQCQADGNAVLLNTMNQGGIVTVEDEQDVTILNTTITIEYTADGLVEWI